MWVHMVAFAVELSDNVKIGPAHATYASQRSCPTTCPLKGNGCYAEYGHVGIHTKRINAVEAGPDEVAEVEAAAIRNLSGALDLRIHVVGDCSTDPGASTVANAALRTLIRGRKAWSYTHAWQQVDRRAWEGVSVLASTETPALAQAAKDAGWATAVIVDAFKSERVYEDSGLKILPCPNQTRGVKCVRCRLCMDDKFLRSKGLTIGFKAHGNGKNKVLQIIGV